MHRAFDQHFATSKNFKTIINASINCMSRNEKQVMENYKILAKKMGDLSHGLNLLNNCESSYSDNITKYHQIDKICSKMCDQTLKNYDADVNKQKDVNNILCVTQNSITSNIDDSVNQVQVLNKIAIDRGVISVSDLQERLSTGRATLKQYNNIQFNEKQLQQKMLKNKSTMLTSSAVCNVKGRFAIDFISTYQMFNILLIYLQNIVKTVENMCFPRVRLLEQWQNKILDFSKCIDDKFTIQSVESSNWNNDMLQKLHASQQQIDKFSLKPFGRDTSIDTTPPKEKFSYPREFATTSSSEQSIKMFQEIRKYMAETEEDLDLAQ
ncbi:uncharacterized protein LOC105276510 isoform X2 [Ooceraea biroi]|uniref:uncharacterized protein LOC105276510 isoform X2 n=1 Tax=Ooceraea biroi TaxID=2015173 RepID=UPI0005BC019D|nr:uncharacterized protein LOC105276510 isoform X2 [Ooceraea biroi]XP_026826263.1 uncharacterized protein LOC105276510 isoform X2 [Ooceraea biroi]